MRAIRSLKQRNRTLFRSADGEDRDKVQGDFYPVRCFLDLQYKAIVALWVWMPLIELQSYPVCTIEEN